MRFSATTVFIHRPSYLLWVICGGYGSIRSILSGSLFIPTKIHVSRSSEILPLSQAVLTPLGPHSPVDLDAGVSVVCQSPCAAKDVDATRLGLAPGWSPFSLILSRLVPAPAAWGGDIWVLDLKSVAL